MGLAPKHGSLKGQKWVEPRRSKPGLLHISICFITDRIIASNKQIADAENALSNLLPKIIHAISIFFQVNMRCLRLGS